MTAVRRLQVVVEETLAELGRPVDVPVTRVAAAAVVANPWHGHGHVADLAERAQAVAPTVAAELVRRLRAFLPDTAAIEAFGKAVHVGMGGEVEHGAALIHTPCFAEVVRASTGGTAVIASTELRAGPGVGVAVPLGHTTQGSRRSHYQGMEVRVAGAPAADEVVVIAAAASGPRPNQRSGDRTTDAPFDAIPWAVTG